MLTKNLFLGYGLGEAREEERRKNTYEVFSRIINCLVSIKIKKVGIFCSARSHQVFFPSSSPTCVDSMELPPVQCYRLEKFVQNHNNLQFCF